MRKGVKKNICGTPTVLSQSKHAGSPIQRSADSTDINMPTSTLNPVDAAEHERQQKHNEAILKQWKEE